MNIPQAPKPLPARTSKTSSGGEAGTSGSDFEAFYRANVAAVAGFFARRSTDPHAVADLTSETFVRAMTSLHTFEYRGSLRGWVFAIARAVYAQHQAELIAGREVVARLSGRVALQDDQIEDLVSQIDAQRDGRELLRRAASLSELERSALELVDLDGLSPQEAAHVLDVGTGALRVRLFRARSRLRKERDDNEQL